MKAKTLRQYPHVNAVGIDQKVIAVLWGPYTGVWHYTWSTGKALLVSKSRVRTGWRASPVYTTLFYTNQGRKRYAVGRKSRSQGCEIFDVLYPLAQVKALQMGLGAKTERFVRGMVNHQTKEALEGIPEWALKLYRSRKCGLEWSTIALNPCREFLCWLNNHPARADIEKIIAKRNFRNCTLKNIRRKFYGAGFNRAEVDMLLNARAKFSEEYLTFQPAEVQFFCMNTGFRWEEFLTYHKVGEEFTKTRTREMWTRGSKRVHKLCKGLYDAGNSTQLIELVLMAKEVNTKDIQGTARWMNKLDYWFCPQAPEIMAQVVEMAACFGILLENNQNRPHMLVIQDMGGNDFEILDQICEMFGI